MDHEVVPYQQRKRQLPEEKCKDHPSKDIDIMCEDCQVPLCSKCAMQDHRKHALNDLETVYSEGFTLCLDEVYKIHQYFLPTSQDIQNDIMKDTKEIKATMDKMRTSMMAEAEILKSLVDTVTSDNIEQINKMEEALIEELQSQNATYTDYISYLEDLVKELHGYLSYTKLQNNPIIFSLVGRLNIQSIPETTKPVSPVFTAGQYSKENVAKLLGRVTVPKSKPKNREIQPMDTDSTQLKSTEKQRKQDREKSDVIQTLSLSSSVTKVREYKVPSVDSVCHISLGKSGRLWASDGKGNLIQTDLEGNQLQQIQTNGMHGYHTVTQDGDLIYKGEKKKVINRMTPKNAVTEFIKTGDWESISIHSSNINGDILVGMRKGKGKYNEAKVTRYNKTGIEIQNIQRGNKGQKLYSVPHYLTENINGDICTSDYDMKAVVVVNKSRQYRFSYTGQVSLFCPWGICTDLLGHILVCNSPAFDFLRVDDSDTVHLLDQDGQFLFILLKAQQGMNNPRGLCVDDENNLHVGKKYTNTVTVYKYLQSMALSKPVVPDTGQDKPVIVQNYLECGTEDCKKNCQFYCNDCHQPMCEHCRDEHQKSPDTKNHEVAPYRQRRRQLPEEKCKDHPNKDIDILCEDCQVPICSKCAIQDHRRHALNDLETIYSEGFTLCLDKIFKIHQYFLPTSQHIQKDIVIDAKEIKTTMDNIRESLKLEAETLKSLIDTVTSENIEKVNKMEESLMEQLQSQDNAYKDYISYLEGLVKEFHGYLSSTKLQNNPLIFSLVDHLNIQPIPETAKPVSPVFTAGQYIKEDVTKLLGSVTVPDIKPDIREIKSLETTSTELKPTNKRTLSSVTKVREFKVPGVGSAHHMSLDKADRVWVSDWIGNLVHADLQGNQLKKIQTSGRLEGYHTVTQDGDLIYTDKDSKVINKTTPHYYKTTRFIETGDWTPSSIHSSRINGDILVGMKKDGEAKVTRYNKTGEEIQNIQRDTDGQELYRNPNYITENINGDICTSDYDKEAVVVVNKSGKHRFSYTGPWSKFCPCGICTDILGHILVSDSISNAFHILDQDGQFLCVLLTEKQGVKRPRGVCVDEENKLYVGQGLINEVTVYEYLR